MSLARDPDFRWFWTGDLVSRFGSRVTEFVLPLLVLTTLGGSGLQVGLLQALYLLPFLLLPLFVGVWLERRARRPVMIAADLARFLLVVSIPVMVALGEATLWYVYLVAVVGGVMTVVYDIAATTYLPHLVAADELAEANGSLSVNQAVSGAGGPALAGWLAKLVGPANALLVDGLSYAASAFALARIRRPEPPPEPPRAVHFGRHLREGVRSVSANPPIRAIALHGAVYNGGVAMVTVALLVRVVRDLGHDSAAYGLVLLAGAAGAVLGSVVAPRLARRIGFGPAMVATLVFSTNSYFLPPLASTGGLTALVLCAGGLFLGSAGAACGGVIATTVRQRLTPPQLYARMNATYRLITFGPLAFGSVAAGVLVDTVGARATLWLIPVVLLVSAVPALTHPVRSLGRDLQVSGVGSQPG